MQKIGYISRGVWIVVLWMILTLSMACLVSAEKVIVAIDPGHGGMDGGTDAGYRSEKEYNFIVAEYLYDYLSKDENFEVILTRTDDTYMKFLPRVMVAMENNADVIISLHFNSNDASYVNGSMAYCSLIEKFDAAPLADRLLDAISDAVPIKRGKVSYVEDTGDSFGVYYWNSEKQWDMPGAWRLGKKSDYYSINTWASKFGIPSIIIEHGYLSNPSDAALIDKDENLRAMAEAQAQAIIDFYTDHTHNFVYSNDFPSNCTVSGTASSRCSVCGMKSGTSPLPKNADGHYWRQTASSKATCTTDGYAEYVCQISYNMNDKGYSCEVHTKRETYPATGHNYQVTVDTKAGHTVDGVHTEVCSLCGDTKTTVTHGDPHVFEITESLSPTCENEGKTVYTCKICGASKEDIYAATGHSWAESAYVPHTDTEDGYRDYTCSVCAQEKRVADLACRHDFAVVRTDPTCTEKGRVVSTCSLCSYETVEESDALGHDYVTQMDTDPTCTEQGFYKGKCSRCGKVVTTTTPAVGHSPVITDETLTHRYFTCEICGFEEVTDIEPELKKIFTPPVIVAIVSFIVLQVIIIGAIWFMHARGKAEEKRRRSRFREEYEPETTETKN